MPRIPNHQIIDDNWDDPEEFDIEHDESRDKLGRKVVPKPSQEDRDWEEKKRKMWRKRHDLDDR